MLIASDGHPFYGEEYTAIPLTTTPRANAVEVLEEHFVEGRLPRRSYATPRNVVTLKHGSITKHAGTISEETVEQLIDRAVAFLRDDV